MPRGASGGGGAFTGNACRRLYDITDRLLPGQAAKRQYAETIALIDRAEASGVKAAISFDALRDAARLDLRQSLGLGEAAEGLVNVANLTDEWAVKLEEMSFTAPDYIDKVAEAFSGVRDVAAEAVTDGIAELSTGFKLLEDVAKSVFRTIQQAALRAFVLNPIENWLKGAGNGPGQAFGGDGFFSSIGRALGIGGRARGGPHRAGEALWVGEEGPELFRPDMSGKIIPAPVACGGRATTGAALNVSLNFYGPVSNGAEVRRSAAQAGAALHRQLQAGARGL